MCLPCLFIDTKSDSFLVFPNKLLLNHSKLYFPLKKGTGHSDEGGIGNGKNHTVNVPLRSGISGRSFYRVFTEILDTCYSIYQPEAIVMQCGCDGLAGDTMKCSWNLDIQTIGKCVERVLQFDKPTILLGGGGYSPTLASKCWTYCTFIASQFGPNGMDVLPIDLPEHEHLTEYRPDFILWNTPSHIKDENTDSFLTTLISNIKLQLM